MRVLVPVPVKATEQARAPVREPQVRCCRWSRRSARVPEQGLEQGQAWWSWCRCQLWLSQSSVCRHKPGTR